MATAQFFLSPSVAAPSNTSNGHNIKRIKERENEKRKWPTKCNFSMFEKHKQVDTRHTRRSRRTFRYRLHKGFLFRGGRKLPGCSKMSSSVLETVMTTLLNVQLCVSYVNVYPMTPVRLTACVSFTNIHFFYTFFLYKVSQTSSKPFDVLNFQKY